MRRLTGALALSLTVGFSGVAPDLGALELGQPEPVYGPRWLKGQVFYR